MKYIKFVKNHTSGNFQEGDHVKVEDVVFDGWTKSEFAEPSTKKEYQKFVNDKAESLANASKKAREDHQAKIDKLSGKGEKVQTINPSGSGEGMGNDNGDGSDDSNDSSNGAGNPSEKLYHALTSEDIEANGIYCEGLEVGTEVEIDDKGLFPLNDEDQMIVKPTE